ncbi:hypothetical protein [Rhodococcus aetherivorans]|uniref:hypothetical protein n=1 Tax=Rhodococcus aetherivorans TaxID=191292 RepID=UPI0029496DCD|nr:hypothetical protein [Rhodococcus aetherivorans]MDV6291465.1 hypothetical protein [Rhodococcus aetherivorans]
MAMSQTPPPSSGATLTLQVFSDQASYLLRTAGNPPAQPVILVDETGAYSATVSTSQTNICEGAEARETGLGMQEWCLIISGVKSGHRLTGKLVGADSTVNLIVQRRDGLTGPLLVALGAVAVAVFLLWIATQRIPQWTNSIRFSQLTGQANGKVSKFVPQWVLRYNTEIDGLREWAKSAEGHLSTEDILARAQWANKRGKAQVLAIRAKLSSKLDDVSQPVRISDCPLRAAVQAEAGRHDVTINDLLSPTGDRDFPSEHLLEVFERAETGLRVVVEFCTVNIERMRVAGVDPDKLKTANSLVEAAKKLAQNFLSEATLDLYLDNLRGYADQVRELADETTGVRDEERITAMALSWSAMVAPVSTALRSVRTGLAEGARTAISLVPIVAVTLLLMVAAAMSLLALQYGKNPIFGTSTDYLTLAGTALTSTMIPAAVAVLAVGRRPREWFG